MKTLSTITYEKFPRLSGVVLDCSSPSNLANRLYGFPSLDDEIFEDIDAYTLEIACRSSYGSDSLYNSDRIYHPIKLVIHSILPYSLDDLSIKASQAQSNLFDQIPKYEGTTCIICKKQGN